MREDYARHCLSFVDVAAIPRLKVVLDTANGMGAVGAAAIFERLPVDDVRMYFELDGTFPNHPADPLLEENRRDIVERVREEGADLGIAWDGDADRCFFVDDTGEYVPGRLRDRAPRRGLRPPRAGGEDRLRRARLAGGRRPGDAPPAACRSMNRVGHAFIKKRMRDENAVFGGEVSGHFYFRENWFADNGMIPALLVLEMLGREGRRLSEILAPAAGALPHLGRDQLARRRRRAALSRASRSATATAASTRLDGISVDYDDWHFNVRPSNTEPLLRLNLEAATRTTWSGGATRCSRSSAADGSGRALVALTPPGGVAMMPGSSASRRA